MDRKSFGSEEKKIKPFGPCPCVLRDFPVEEMLAAGTISIFPEGERHEVVSLLGVIPKGSEGRFRLIINTRYVNEHMVKTQFKFEGPKDLADMAEKWDHVVSFDLTSGYYHVELHPHTRTYTGFEWKDRYYYYNYFPFGFATSPWVFSEVTRELVMFWRKGGISVLPYLDDFIVSKKGR